MDEAGARESDTTLEAIIRSLIDCSPGDLQLLFDRS
jgi:hypothetical protein